MPCLYTEHIVFCGCGGGFTVGRLPRHLRRKNRRQAMGWGGGTDIMREAIPKLVEDVPDVEQRKRIYRTLWSALRGNDYDQELDTLGIDPVWDAIIAPDLVDEHAEAQARVIASSDEIEARVWREHRERR